ncbi:hypothetical protein LINGRAHAP2_LOCUS30713, partial [Linum grandiflorum]
FIWFDPSEDEDIDDIFDESLLPLQEETVEESQRFESRIENDLLAQKLKEAADTLAQASNSVPKTFKIGSSRASKERTMITDSPQVIEPEAKSKSRKRQGSARKENANKKQSTDAKKVEAASLKWLPNDK